MFLPQDAHAAVIDLFLQTQRLLIPAQVRIGVSKIIHCRQGIRMLLPQAAPAAGIDLFLQTQRLLIAAQVRIGVSKIIHCHQGIRMLLIAIGTPGALQIRLRKGKTKLIFTRPVILCSFLYQQLLPRRVAGSLADGVLRFARGSHGVQQVQRLIHGHRLSLLHVLTPGSGQCPEGVRGSAEIVLRRTLASGGIRFGQPLDDIAVREGYRGFPEFVLPVFEQQGAPLQLLHDGFTADMVILRSQMEAPVPAVVPAVDPLQLVNGNRLAAGGNQAQGQLVQPVVFVDIREIAGEPFFKGRIQAPRIGCVIRQIKLVVQNHVCHNVCVQKDALGVFRQAVENLLAVGMVCQPLFQTPGKVCANVRVVGSSILRHVKLQIGLQVGDHGVFGPGDDNHPQPLGKPFGAEQLCSQPLAFVLAFIQTVDHNAQRIVLAVAGVLQRAGQQRFKQLLRVQRLFVRHAVQRIQQQAAVAGQPAGQLENKLAHNGIGRVEIAVAMLKKQGCRHPGASVDILGRKRAFPGARPAVNRAQVAALGIVQPGVKLLRQPFTADEGLAQVPALP